MCPDHHDGTCSGTLSCSPTDSETLVMTLVCERCKEVVKTLGSFQHKFDPLLTADPNG
jgi:hypothetical protein